MLVQKPTSRKQKSVISNPGAQSPWNLSALLTGFREILRL